MQIHVRVPAFSSQSKTPSFRGQQSSMAPYFGASPPDGLDDLTRMAARRHRTRNFVWGLPIVGLLALGGCWGIPRLTAGSGQSPVTGAMTQPASPMTGAPPASSVLSADNPILVGTQNLSEFAGQIFQAGQCENLDSMIVNGVRNYYGLLNILSEAHDDQFIIQQEGKLYSRKTGYLSDGREITLLSFPIVAPGSAIDSITLDQMAWSDGKKETDVSAVTFVIDSNSLDVLRGIYISPDDNLPDDYTFRLGEREQTLEFRQGVPASPVCSGG